MTRGTHAGSGQIGAVFLMLVVASTVVFPAAPAPPRASGLVGRLCDPGRIVVQGAATWTSEEVVEGLVRTYAFVTASHPRAQLATFLDYVRETVATGYRRGGFPDPRVSVALDEGGGRIVVAVVEGPRYRAGEVIVEGARKLPGDLVRAELTEPGRGALIPSRAAMAPVPPNPSEPSVAEPFWTPGEPARFDAATIAAARKRVENAYGRAGYLAPKADVRVVPGTEEGTAPLVVTIREEGDAYHLRRVEIEGGFNDDPDVLRRFLGVEEGMVAPVDLAPSLLRRLEGLGRYLGVEVEARRDETRPLVDLRMRLEQAEFAPPFGEPVSAERSTMRRAVEWLQTPERWGGGFVVRGGDASVSGIAAARFGLPPDVQMEYVLAGRGMAFLFDAPSPDEGAADEGAADEGAAPTGRRVLLGAVVDESELLLYSEPLALVSRAAFGPGAVIIVNCELGTSGDEEDPFRMVFGFGVRSAREDETARFRVNLRVAEVVLTEFERRRFLLRREGGELLVLPRAEAGAVGDDGGETEDGSTDGAGKEPDADDASPYATIDPATGRLAVRFRREGPESWIEARFEEDVLRERRERLLARSRATGAGSASIGRFAASGVARVLDGLGLDRPAGPLAGRGPILEILAGRLLRPGGPCDRSLAALGQRLRKRGDDAFSFGGTAWRDLALSRGPIAYFGTLFAARLAPRMPPGSWPETLLRETACILSGRAEHTLGALSELLGSRDVGPVGYWVIAEGLRRIGQVAPSRFFARRALQCCDRAGFDRELDLLDRFSPEWIREVGLSVVLAATLDGRSALDVERALARFEARSPLEAAGLLEAGGRTLEPSELVAAGRAFLEAIWLSGVEGRLRARLEIIAR